MSDQGQLEHRIATIALVLFLMVAGVAAGLATGFWWLLPLGLVYGASHWVDFTSRSPQRTNHPAFLNVFELLARKKTFSFRYLTLLAFVLMASCVALAAIKIMETFPEKKFAFVVFLFFAVPVVLYLTLFIEVLQLPKEDKSDEDRGGKPGA
ncbi:MAG: hypothetical protein L6R28_14090 [Planctomycetes bacterium]|nr:hypothetical protein [Planctomycetota bacterium]